MLEYFLNKKAIVKINILTLLIFSNDGVFLEELMAKFNISRNSALRHIEEINTDFSDISNPISILINSHGRYYINIDNTMSKAFIVSQLKEYYIKRSSLYSVFRGIILSDLSVNGLSEFLNFSSSTIYHKISQLNNLTKSFNCEIDLSNPGRFKGDEFGIRTFLFIILLFTNKSDTDKIFNSIISKNFLNLENIKNNLITRKELSLSQETKLQLLQGIILFRIQNRQQYVEYSGQFLNDAQYFFEDKFELISSDDEELISKIKSESNAFCFFVRALIFDIDSFKKKNEIVNKYKHSSLEIAKEVALIMELFSTYASFTYSESGYVESYYLLLQVLIFFQHFNLDFPKFYEFKLNIVGNKESIETSFLNNEKKIQEFLTNDFFANKFSNVSPLLFKQLTHIFYFIFDINRQPTKLKIYVQFSKDIYTGSILTNSLMTTFSQNSIEIIHDPKSADLIISDVFEGGNLEAERFNFENVYDYAQWDHLLHYVTDLIYRKSFFKNIK